MRGRAGMDRPSSIDDWCFHLRFAPYRATGRELKIIPVTLAERSHPFPSRTRKLSSPAPKILGGQLPGKIGRRRDFHTSVALAGSAIGGGIVLPAVTMLGAWIGSVRSSLSR